MVKKIKEKLMKASLPLAVMIANTSPVFADDLTRKINTGTTWFIGVATAAAGANVVYAIWSAGNAKTNSEIDETTKYKKNAIWGFVGVTVASSLIALWKSW